MTREEFEQELKKYKYTLNPAMKLKPGWNGNSLMLELPAPDINNPEVTVPVTGWFSFPGLSLEQLTVEQLDKIVRHMFHRMAIHEAEESLTKDGVQMNNPHARDYREPSFDPRFSVVA